jgi:cytochrome c556
MKRNTAVALALVIGLASAGAGLAAGSADDMIATRQAEMKTNMKAMKVLVSMLKGETPYDNALVLGAATSIKDARAASDAKGAWDAASQTGATMKTEAKAEIWTDAAGFSAAWLALDTAVAGLAATTDAAGLKAAFPALGAACKGCHEKYRAAE